MNRILHSISFILVFGLAACERPAPEAVPERSAEAAQNTVEAVIDEDNKGLILVTGATGTQGGAVARELLKRGYSVRGLTRDPESERAQALAELGATMVQGDFSDPASLAAAMQGVDGVFGVTLFWQYGYDAEVEMGEQLIDAARIAGVDRFVLTSVASADQATGIPHFESKWEVEQYLHNSDLDWTIIRPVEFMENWYYSVDNFRQGRLIDPRDPESSHQWIAASDIGFFVGEAFDNPDQWIGLTQEIAGDELTLAELQAALSDAFGQPFEYIQPGWEEYGARTSEEFALMYEWFENEGYSVDVAALRARYPNLISVAEFLPEMAGIPAE